jgi:cellulose synthase/poly-beta-1,6-N-acetylglucosamine synthase-like glycosyltransferase
MSVQILRQQQVQTDISIVIPIRSLEQWRVYNILEGIEQQNIPIEIILSDYGSDKNHLEELKTLVEKYDATLLHVDTNELWSRGIACNIGIRRSNCKYIIILDGDIIMEPKTINDTLSMIKDQKKAVIRQPVFLDKSFNPEKLIFPECYEILNKQKEFYIAPSYGSFMATDRKWWFEMQGFDERLKIWGSDDWDVWNRMAQNGIKRTVIGRSPTIITEPPKEGCKIYHQWHDLEVWKRHNITKELFDFHRKRNREFINKSNMIKNNKYWGLSECQ